MFREDGFLYVANGAGNDILRFDAATGTNGEIFVAPGSGGLATPHGFLFGPDGNGDGIDDLYVGGVDSASVTRYDAMTGDLIDVFVEAGEGGILSAASVLFMAVAFGDGDGDGDIDLQDYAGFLDCVTGPDGGEISPDCEPYDFDEDNDVDLPDFGNLQRMYTGACGIEFTQQPDDVTVCEGDSAVFVVQTVVQNLGFQWRFDGVNLPGETSSTLIIDPVGPDDTGLYQCLVSDNCDSIGASDTATLAISLDAAISQQPEGGSFCSGDNIFLFVSAVGAETYQWFKDGEALPDEIEFFLSIIDAGIEDSGAYEVDVIGACDTVTSEPAIVEVIDCDPGP